MFLYSFDWIKRKEEEKANDNGHFCSLGWSFFKLKDFRVLQKRKGNARLPLMKLWISLCLNIIGNITQQNMYMFILTSGGNLNELSDFLTWNRVLSVIYFNLCVCAHVRAQICESNLKPSTSILSIYPHMHTHNFYPTPTPSSRHLPSNGWSTLIR